ncbi:hypothetical protein LUZ60_005234 [Juncus effusus]|nr:hypothetical protein LUZ60_005234 [Juncus effusus]
MDLDEWELLPSSKTYREFSHESKDLLSKSLFISPELFVETDYFKCPELFVKSEEKPEIFKDIAISNEFKKEEAPPPSTENWVEPEPIQFDENTTKADKESIDDMIQLEKKNEYFFEEEKKNESIEERYEKEKDDCIGFNLWGLRINGIGAICSFGIATVATLCVFVLSGGSNSNSDRQTRNPKLQFQIYSDDKRIKEVVQRATRINHAMSAARGITTIPRAQISFGGYYEGL